MAPSRFHLLPLVLSLGAADVFRVKDATYGEGDEAIRLKILRNTRTNESAEILSGWGGKVEALRLIGKNGLRDIIYNHGGDASKIRSDSSPGAVLSPFSNRVANGTYNWEGQTYYLKKNSANNAMHGFLIGGQTMDVVNEEADDKHATVTLRFVFGGEEGYPFNVSLTVMYTLFDGRLEVNATATNVMDDGSAPFMFGLHPYWRVADVSKTVITFDPCSNWNYIEVTPAPDLIPTGHFKPVGPPFDGSSTIGGNFTNPTQYDAGFKAITPGNKCPYLHTTIEDGDDRLVLKMDRSFRFLQIYTGAPEKGVAVEPQAGETNCWNNKDAVIALLAGETWNGRFELAINQ